MDPFEQAQARERDHPRAPGVPRADILDEGRTFVPTYAIRARLAAAPMAGNPVGDRDTLHEIGRIDLHEIGVGVGRHKPENAIIRARLAFPGPIFVHPQP